MFYILKDLIANVSIMIAGFYIVGKLIREPIGEHSKPRHKYRLSYLAASIGVLLMLFSIQVTEAVMIDLRHIPVIITAYFAGAVPAIVTAGMIASSRLLFGITDTSITAFFSMVFIGITVAAATSFFKKGRYRMLFKLNIISMIIISINLYLVIPEQSLYWKVLLYMWLIALPAGVFAVVFFNDIQNSKIRFLQLLDDVKTDFLTGLGNVRQFDQTLDELVKTSKKDQKGFSLLLIDVDHFKSVNDMYGHYSGDTVLTYLGELLSENSRPTDQVSRNGGEEFSILLPDCSLDAAIDKAERIRETVESSSFTLSDGTSIFLSVSVGVSHYNALDPLKVDMYKKADQALYKAKAMGRNKVCV